MRYFKMSNIVSTRIKIATTIFKTVMFATRKMPIPTGRPITLPAANRLKYSQLTSCLILATKANEMTSESSKLNCIASRTSNIRIKNGVAKIEKPKPVLVCKTEESNMSKINKITESINDTFHARKRDADLASEGTFVCKHSSPLIHQREEDSHAFIAVRLYVNECIIPSRLLALVVYS